MQKLDKKLVSRLPIRPRILIPVYWFLYFFLIFSAWWNSPFASYLGMLAMLGVLTLHSIWIYQALTFLSNLKKESGTPPKITSILLARYYLLFFGGIFLAALQLNAHHVPFIGGAVALALLVSIWIAARALCKAEYEKNPPVTATIGPIFKPFYTFATLLYLSFMAAQLYSRLAKLQTA